MAEEDAAAVAGVTKTLCIGWAASPSRRLSLRTCEGKMPAPQKYIRKPREQRGFFFVLSTSERNRDIAAVKEP